eukprot:1033703-Rhodomonas_salina.2
MTTSATHTHTNKPAKARQQDAVRSEHAACAYIAQTSETGGWLQFPRFRLRWSQYPGSGCTSVGEQYLSVLLTEQYYNVVLYSWKAKVIITSVWYGLSFCTLPKLTIWLLLYRRTLLNLKLLPHHATTIELVEEITSVHNFRNASGFRYSFQRKLKHLDSARRESA